MSYLHHLYLPLCAAVLLGVGLCPKPTQGQDAFPPTRAPSVDRPIPTVPSSAGYDVKLDWQDGTTEHITGSGPAPARQPPRRGPRSPRRGEPATGETSPPTFLDAENSDGTIDGWDASGGLTTKERPAKQVRAGPRQAQAGTPAFSNWAVQVDAGPSFPLAPSPFSNHYNTGVSAGLAGSAALTSNLRAEATARFQRTAPSDAAPLVAAPSGTEVSGAEFSLAALGVGARYGVPLLRSLVAHAALRVGGAWTQVGRVQVGMGGQSTTLDASSEVSPWGEVGVGLRYRIGPVFSVVLEPQVATALTSERTTRVFSVGTGVQISL